MDPVPRRRLPRPSGSARRLLRARRWPTTWARWPARWSRCPGATRSRRATDRPAASSPSRPTSATPTARARWRPTCWSGAPPSSRSAASTRACARPRTPTSAGACSRPAGGSSCAGAPRSSIATGARWASCAASGAATRPAAPGWPAATTGSHPSRPWSARWRPAAPPRPARDRLGEPASAGRAGAARVARRRSRRRAARARPLPGPRRAAVGRGAGRARAVQPPRRSPAAAPADVVVVADRFPVRGDPRGRVRASARARPRRGRGPSRVARPALWPRELQVDYREDDGIAARAGALLALVAAPPAALRRRLRGPRTRRAGSVGAGARRARACSAIAGARCSRSAARRSAPPRAGWRGWPAGRSTSRGADARREPISSTPRRSRLRTTTRCASALAKARESRSS